MSASKKELIPSSDYIIRTFTDVRFNNMERRSLLPAYPMHRLEERPSYLLLPNVHTIDRDFMEMLSYSGNDDDVGNHEYCPFTFTIDSKHEFIPSFIIDFYQKLFQQTSNRWKLPCSLIDYNLIQLEKYMNRHSKQTGEAALALLSELPMALEFYLQIDGTPTINRYIYIVLF